MFLVYLCFRMRSIRTIPTAEINPAAITGISGNSSPVLGMLCVSVVCAGVGTGIGAGAVVGVAEGAGAGVEVAVGVGAAVAVGVGAAVAVGVGVAGGMASNRA